MDRLNYFNAYNSKESHHEDQLTRAYLVLLKHSPHAFFSFIDYCRSKHEVSKGGRSISLIDFLEHGWEIDTQRNNPTIETNYLLSTLITDSKITSSQSDIQSSGRNARYDGIIKFGNYLTIVIENKPRSSNIWFEQLKPSRQNLSDDTIVYSSPAILEWKEIIKHLNHIMAVPTISSHERIMIEDFLSYIDQQFPFLNPYDSFYQCKGNNELLSRRIHNLLKSISIDENNVKYHKGWGYYIQTPYSQIQKIGLILNQKEKEWSLELSLFFGASQTQAKSFYSSDPDLKHFKNTDWGYFPNFHVAFMTSNLVWFRSPDSAFYLKFWKQNIDKIYQQKREDVPKYLKWLTDEKVIIISPETDAQLDLKFYNTAMQTLNICPELGLIYTFGSSDAVELDRSGKLSYTLNAKIREGLRLAELDGNDILKRI